MGFITHHRMDRAQHAFTKACREMGIEHRLTRPYHPWTNGQVERMNRTLKEATVKIFYYKRHGVCKEICVSARIKKSEARSLSSHKI